MARYGRQFGEGRFEPFAGRGMPGTWTHHGAGHGRGGGISEEEAWRTNRGEYRRPGRYDHAYRGRALRYGEDFRGNFPGMEPGGGAYQGRDRGGYDEGRDRAGRRYWRSRSGYGGDFRRGYDRGW